MAEPQTMDEAVVKMHTAFEALKEQNDRQEKEIKSFGQASGETLERLEKAETALDEAQDFMTKAQAQLGAISTLKDELETKMQLMERQGATGKPAEHTDEYQDAYYKWMRGGECSPREMALRGHRRSPWFKMSPGEEETLNKGEVEFKNIATDSGETGGYAMPAAQRGTFIEKLIEFSPIEELASVVDISLGDSYDATADGDQNFTCSWVSEREGRGETQAGQLRKVSIPAHEAYANPFLSRKSLDDPAFDLAVWTNRRLPRRFSVLFGTAYVNGTDEGQPAGLATNSNRQTNSVVSGHATQITADGLIDLVFDLPEFYERGASFLWRRATLKEVRKLKESGTGAYLFAPATEATPATVLGKTYREAVDWPAIAANAFSVGFGDWEAAYLIVRRQDIFQMRDPYTNKPFIEFYTTMRRGGRVVLPEAYRLQKIAAS